MIMNINKLGKFIALMAIAFAANTCAMNVHAADDIKIHVDGVPVSTEFAPFIENSYTYLAARTVGDIVGANKVDWNNEEKSVTISADETDVKLVIGSEYAVVDGIPINTGVTPVIRNDRTYLPVRFIAETFGADVNWDGGTKTVFINMSEYEAESTEFDWLARIVNAEAGGESYEGKLAVANVILNRVASPDFPNTIYGVVFDKYNNIYQFTPVANGYIYTEPNAESIIAAQDALNGANNIEDCLYFNGVEMAETSWAALNREYYTQIGGHCFFR